MADGPCRIALDAMGGDNAPRSTLEGAALALAEMPDLHLLLVGRSDEIGPNLSRCGIRGGLLGRVKTVHAESVVAMDDKATCVLKEKMDSSVRAAANCVHLGEADGMVSVGHTGAAMVATLRVLGALPGVDRPSLATVLPSYSGTPTVLLDVGAVLGCKAEQIAQFALMGAVYAEEVLGVSRPRIGVLSVGEEDAKGSDVTRQACALLRGLDINFGGNAEGGDIWRGAFDVIACDGFVGNVVLKSSEALGEELMGGMRACLSASPAGRAGALLIRRPLRQFYKKMDYAEYGGALLLGVKGVSIIGHGRSDGRAVSSAIRAAALGVKTDITARIQTRLVQLQGNGPA